MALKNKFLKAAAEKMPLLIKELEKLYDPKNVEDRIYKSWLDGKYFHANLDETIKTQIY